MGLNAELIDVKQRIRTLEQERDRLNAELTRIREEALELWHRPVRPDQRIEEIGTRLVMVNKELLILKVLA